MKEFSLFHEQVCAVDDGFIQAEPLLGLWANAVAGEGILTLGRAQAVKVSVRK